ncbi:MAG: glycosyltransferase family 2 protein, partial [Flavobacteriales bacterium]|nr:glycosyltransferase family 2 protein [Flavobacteriales bacterium]
MDNLVSIITPCYNSEQYIEDCINSVIAQSYDKWEMIIVDDCSSDASLKKIMLFSDIDSRIRIIKLEENHGAAVARNIALEDANGSFIAFLDADDFWEPLKLERQINIIKKNNTIFN